MSYPFFPTPKPFYEKKENTFTFDSLVQELRGVISNLPDKRTFTHSYYSMQNIALSAFSLFFTQNPSFLQFQRDMKKARGKSNAQSLFQIDKILIDKSYKRYYGCSET